ncbi:MAG: hypothetical protein IPM29_30755 [Planctomycetes bacterium]|nr:hypothetical protein [Planctomycetota bacterium]
MSDTSPPQADPAESLDAAQVDDATNASDAAENAAPKKPFEPILEDQSFHEMLKSHLGKIFLVATPESFEETGLSPQITAGWYKAKLVGLGRDYLIVATEFHHGLGKHATKEPCNQYIPISHIKRISLMRRERLLHL